MAENDSSQKDKFRLPCSLDIENASLMIPYFNLAHGGEWGLFCDGDGRVIAQQVDSVLNNTGREYFSEQAQQFTGDNCKKSDSLSMKGMPGMKSVSTISREVESICSNEPESLCKSKRTSNQMQEEELKESVLSQDNLESLDGIDDSTNLPEDLEKVEIQLIDGSIGLDLGEFPCIKDNWYVSKPLSEGMLIDETSVINTTNLANDVRKFLKHLGISLADFSKHHLNRTQGTLSDLLNHPKDWENLSERGKGIYIKMMEFLSAVDLHELIFGLRRFQKVRSSVNRLSDDLLDALSNGEMPTDGELQLVSEKFQLNFEYLKNYCNDAIKNWNYQEDEGNIQLNSGTPPTYTYFCSVSCDFNNRKKGHGEVPKFLDKHICTFVGCGAILSSKASFEAHLLYHTRLQPYNCAVCDGSYSTKYNLKSHLKIHSKSVKYTNRISKRARERMMAQSCGSEELYKSLSVTSHKQGLLSRMKYICGVCWEGFGSRQKLNKHLLQQHEVSTRNLRKGFTCYVCAKSTKNISSLVVHMRSHTNFRPFECKLCNMGFHTKANLRRHNRTHTGEKPFVCHVCGGKFTEAKSVAIHMRKHTGEKPYSCSVCNKRFSQRGPLQVHSLIHRNEKPHLCELCGQSFRQKINLHMHVKRHKGLKKHTCSICGNCFLTKYDFERHLHKHNDKRPGKSRTCDLQNFEYLGQHENTSQRLFILSCQYCGEKFSDDNTRKKHVQQVHDTSDDENMLLQSTLNHEKTKAALQETKYVSTKKAGQKKENLFVSPKAVYNIIATVQTLRNPSFMKPMEKSVASTSGTMEEQENSFILTSHSSSQVSRTTEGEHSRIVPQEMNISDEKISVTDSRYQGVLTQSSLMFSSSSTDSIIREQSVPMALEADVHSGVGQNTNMVEDSDPNMQSVVVESTEDHIILSENRIMTSESEKQLKLSEDINAFQVIMPRNSADNNIIIAMNVDHHVAMDNNVNSNSTLLHRVGNEHDPQDDNNQTYIVVDLELD